MITQTVQPPTQATTAPYGSGFFATLTSLEPPTREAVLSLPSGTLAALIYSAASERLQPRLVPVEVSANQP